MIVDDLAALAAPIDKLDLLPGNPRRGDVDAVAKSLAAFGQRKPIVARRDGTVIAGNHTLQAARQLGWPKIAVVWVDDDDTTAKAFALADNRTAELGTYDDQLLADLIAEVHNADPDLLIASGWSDEATKQLLDALAVNDPTPTIHGDPDDVPESAPAKTIPGDVWLLGPHRLVCGDSTAPTDVDKLMAGGKADMVWTDPPYGVSYVGKTADALTIDNDDLDAVQLESFLRLALSEALNACRPGAAWFVAAPAGPLFLPFAKVLNDLKVWRQTLVWLKSVLVMGRSDYHYRHESIFYGWKPGAAHTEPPDRKGDTIWEFDKPQRNAEHPTMKPVALIERAIINHTKHNDVVLDLFGGSGSTLIAAHQTGRIARLMELDPKYCDVICKRWQQATGIKPIAEATGNEHDFLEVDDGVAARKAT